MQQICVPWRPLQIGTTSEALPKGLWNWNVHASEFGFCAKSLGIFSRRVLPSRDSAPNSKQNNTIICNKSPHAVATLADYQQTGCLQALCPLQVTLLVDRSDLAWPRIGETLRASFSSHARRCKLLCCTRRHNRLYVWNHNTEINRGGWSSKPQRTAVPATHHPPPAQHEGREQGRSADQPTALLEIAPGVQKSRCLV